MLMQPLPAKIEGCEGFWSSHPLLQMFAREELLSCGLLQNGGQLGINIGYGPMDVSARWFFCFQLSISVQKWSLGPKNLIPPGVSPSTTLRGDNLVAQYAVETSKQLTAGLITSATWAIKPCLGTMRGSFLMGHVLPCHPVQLHNFFFTMVVPHVSSWSMCELILIQRTPTLLEWLLQN